jgi:hypothetical protein
MNPIDTIQGGLLRLAVDDRTLAVTLIVIGSALLLRSGVSLVKIYQEQASESYVPAVGTTFLQREGF